MIRNMFSKKKEVNEFKPSDNVVIETTEVVKEKTVYELVEEIHDTFFTEVDRLLKSANEFNSLETNKQELIDKHDRLQSLGFTSSKEVKEASGEIKRLEELRKENKKKEELIDAINYFSFKYPQYKFITEGSVKKICQKYGLVYGSVDKYIGEVPDKNLKHIEDFKIDEDDEAWVKFIGNNRSRVATSLIISKKDIPEEQDNTINGIDFFVRYDKESLEIAAPLKDFNMEKSVVKDQKIQNEVPDPIVLKPVIFNKTKHYLIVTAWGPEASDELVVNHKMN